MPAPDGRSPALLRAIRRARVRLLWVKISDGLLLCSAAATALIGLAVVGEARGEPHLTPWLLAAATATCAVVLARALRHSPTDLSAAMDLDQRNRLADLLSTAWTDHKTTDPWTKQIQLLAEAACDRLDFPPLTGRFVPRLHVAAAVALVAAIAGLLLVQSPTDPRDQSIAIANDIQQPSATAPSNRFLNGGLRTTREGETDIRLPGESRNPSAAGGSSEKPSGAGSNARGAGRAEGSPTPDTPRIAPSNPDRSANMSTASISSGGHGAAATIAGTSNASGGSVVANDSTNTAPWANAGWPAQRDAALSQLRDGRVPDGYRAMVKAYFER